VISRLDDRGQLMLVGAVVIAVSLLALAVVLNSTIYTQNTNPGDTLGETREVEKQLQVIQTDITRLTDRLTQRDSYVDTRELNATLAFYSDRKAEQIVNRRSAYIDVKLNRSASSFGREVLRQSERSGEIVSKGDDRDWTLVENTTFNESTPFKMEIEPQDAGYPTSTAFIVEGDDGGIWRLSVTQDPPNAVEVNVVYDNGTTTTATVSGSLTQINVTSGIVNGTQSFAFAPGLEAPYDLRVENGHRSNGTYSIMIDKFGDIEDENFHTAPTKDNPYVSREIAAAVVDIQYVSDEVSAQSQIEVVLKEGSE